MHTQEEIPLRSHVTPKCYQDCNSAENAPNQPEVELKKKHVAEAGEEEVAFPLETDGQSSSGTDPELHGYSLANKIFRTVAIDAAYFGAVSNIFNKCINNVLGMRDGHIVT